jgi:hypothetical protein
VAEIDLSMLRNQRWRSLMIAVLASAMISLACLGDALAFPALQSGSLAQTAAIVRSGVVWFDDGPVFLKGVAGSTLLGTVRGEDRRSPRIASSASAVAVRVGEGNVRVREEHLRLGEEPAGEETEFLGGVPPGPVVAIAQPKPVGGGGCEGWVPGGEAFVVAEDDLVAAGECEEDEPQERQPLFVRSLRGGRWRVLRWLPGDSEPMMLAAEGDLVAVGLAISRTFSSAEMHVSILNVRNLRTQARFDVPYGHLAFASRDRLVLSVATHNQDSQIGPSSTGYSLALYSTRGRRFAALGSAEEPPLVSDMHMVSEENQTVSVRSVTAAHRGQ